MFLDVPSVGHLRPVLHHGLDVGGVLAVDRRRVVGRDDALKGVSHAVVVRPRGSVAERTLQVLEADLEGTMLDTWVAFCLGALQDTLGRAEPHRRRNLCWRGPSAGGYFRAGRHALYEDASEYRFRPSSSWAHGGPVVHCNAISLAPAHGHWTATLDRSSCDGPGPLVAAMRALVLHCCGERVVDTHARWVHAPVPCHRLGVRPVY